MYISFAQNRRRALNRRAAGRLILPEKSERQRHTRRCPAASHEDERMQHWLLLVRWVEQETIRQKHLLSVHGLDDIAIPEPTMMSRPCVNPRPSVRIVGEIDAE